MTGFGFLVFDEENSDGTDGNPPAADGNSGSDFELPIECGEPEPAAGGKSAPPAKPAAAEPAAGERGAEAPPPGEGGTADSESAG